MIVQCAGKKPSRTLKGCHFRLWKLTLLQFLKFVTAHFGKKNYPESYLFATVLRKSTVSIRESVDSLRRDGADAQ